MADEFMIEDFDLELFQGEIFFLKVFFGYAKVIGMGKDSVFGVFFGYLLS